MGRKINRNYYDHDDRTNDNSHNTRKVSFMNGSGRIRKNKRPDQIVVQYTGDDDVDMDGNKWKPWKGGNQKNRKYFKNRPGSPAVQGPRFPQKPLRPSDWYQIKILYGAKYEKKHILQLLLKHIQPNIFIPNSYGNSGKDAYFYVEDFETAKILRGANKKIAFDDGFLMEIRVREALPPPVPLDDKVKEKIKAIMAKRYIAENKALDLTKFASDPDFDGDMYCPLSRSGIQKIVWQIISENISDLVAINLSDNKISMFDDALSIEVKKVKNLKILHLGQNRVGYKCDVTRNHKALKSVHALNCFRDLEITELVLSKNPLTNGFKDNTHYVRYDEGITGCGADTIGLFHSEIRKKFPKLVKLDDIELPPVISFDVGDEAKLPTPQPAFMCNPEGRGVVTMFLSQYFAIYDSDNRLDLGQAYHENSSFSLCAFYPQNQKSSGNKLNSYMQESRNLFRVTDYPRRKSRLHTGKQNIVQFLTQLPKTQHDLSSFVVDLTLCTPALMNFSVSGVFREPSFSTVSSSWPVRHFSRTFLIVPVGQGFCIVNDMLMVTNATEREIECSFKEGLNTPTAQSPVSSQPGPSIGSPISNANLDESVKLQMVQTLATRTGMNLEWSKKCLDETQWNFDRAIWTFTELQSKGSIPAEAFVK